MTEVHYFTLGLIIGLGFLVMTYVTRAGLYIPRPWHQFMPFSIMLIGLYIGQKLKATYDVILTVASMEIGALIAWTFQAIAGLMYQAYLTGSGSGRKEAPAPKPEESDTLIDWNTGRVIKRVKLEPTVINAQVTAAPRFDAERMVARTLIDQRNHNLKVDLTESFWVKRGNFKGSRDQFVEMKDKWIRHGIIYKTGDRKNAPSDVRDWRKVRLIADGNPLPTVNLLR